MVGIVNDEVVLSVADQALIDAVSARVNMQNIAMAADNEPYGSVEYADPGYQADKKKRYPLNSETRVRAAWSYINMPKNAAKYTPAQVSHIKSKIKSAGKKYNIEYSEDKKSQACLHTAFAAHLGQMASIETDQIEAAKNIRKLILQLLVMEAEELGDEEDEDTYDLECLLSAVHLIEQFINNEDWECFFEEMEDERGDVAKAARAQADSSTFNCPGCGSTVKLKREVKAKLVKASDNGGETMALSEAEITAIATQTAAIIMAATRTVEDVRAQSPTTNQDTDPKLVLRADQRTTEDVRAQNPATPQDSDPKETITDLQTISSQESAAVAAKNDGDGKPDPTDNGKISPQPENQAAGNVDGKTEPKTEAPKEPVKASDGEQALPDAPSGGQARTVQDVRAQASEQTEAYKHPEDHKDDKTMNDGQNPARASEAEAAAKPKDDGDEDDKASASAPQSKDGGKGNEDEDKEGSGDGKSMASINSIGRIRRSYNLNDKADLEAWFADLEANQKANEAFTGMANMNVIPTERQTAHASARRAEGGQTSTLGESPRTNSGYDLNGLFSKNSK